MAVKIIGTQIELRIVSDIILDNEDGSQKVVKRNILSRCIINIEDITGIAEVITAKGKTYKSITRVQHRDIGPLVVKGNYDKVKELIYKTNKIGFK